MLDNVAVRSIAKHRNKLMSLVESTKKRKKKKQKTWAVPPSNIEHLVFKKIPTSPIDPGPNFIGNRLNFGEESEADDPEEDSYDELDTVSVPFISLLRNSTVLPPIVWKIDKLPSRTDPNRAT
ncbi:uncharacterized protein CDAR_449331 [Caerostris darwini]|uniref:Uncharacterized protein n=1 Tax=Caerostris darwini TaxID=1538125 RepID=A0AAV4QT23_9ARAC|nr:uncharacterized protein CDAR_449331 [Caerostris darwini]